MTRRHPAAVVLLTLVTFGLYAYYWLYKTTDELREHTGRRDLSPIVDVALAIVTVGLWGAYAGYRNAGIVHAELTSRGVAHHDQSLAVAAAAALSLVTGWAWLVSIGILQTDLNLLAADRTVPIGAAPYMTIHEATPTLQGTSALHARVEVPARTAPAADESHWETIPSAPVFTSNAPAPIVY